jgi:hypothetical protein
MKRKPLPSLLKAREIFSLPGWILRLVTAEPDRVLLCTRIFRKISGTRRGRLYLPSYLPAEVRVLSKLSTAQLRRCIYPPLEDDTNLRCLSHETVDYVHRVFPGGRLRTVDPDISVHVRQRKAVKPACESDWPRLGTRAAWPSSPTFAEMLAMGLRGETPLPMQKPLPAINRLRLSEFNSSVALRARLISKQVLGIRSDIEVPKKFLVHFRYRWNFLILAAPYNLPAGLVRFLTGQWIANPHNLWLREKCSFKNFLKKTETTGLTSRLIGPW